MSQEAPSADHVQASVSTDLNSLTVNGYEDCAREYARSTAPNAPGGEDEALVELLKAIGGGRRVLEIGSGPGWDADWLESRGLKVRRTDAAQAFVSFQNSRGKIAERLNLLSDPLGGPYDGILALYVLQHIERCSLPPVLKKISQAIRVGGAFLFSIREGFGETVERGSRGGSYYVASWQKAELLDMMEPLGFRLLWSKSSQDNEGRWIIALFKKVDRHMSPARESSHTSS